MTAESHPSDEPRGVRHTESEEPIVVGKCRHGIAIDSYCRKCSQGEDPPEASGVTLTS